MKADRLRVGFVPLIDAAALLVAVDKGFAVTEGLAIDLIREVSWSNVRDFPLKICEKLVDSW